MKARRRFASGFFSWFNESMNPYQSPSLVQPTDPSSGVTDGLVTNPGLRDLFPLAAVGPALSGLRAARFGYAIVLAGLLWQVGATLLFRQNTTIAIGLTLFGLLPILMGLVSWIGPIPNQTTRFSSGVGGRDSGLASIAAALLVLGAAGLVAYVTAILSGRAQGNLVHLFGASAFAMTLSAQAIIAIMVGLWSAKFQARPRGQWAMTSVLGYAICAAIVSSLSLGVATGLMDNAIAALIAPLALLVAIVVQLVTMTSLIVDFAKVSAAEPLDSAGKPH